MTFLFIVSALFSVSIAYFLRDRFSGADVKRRYVALCIVYNFFWAFSYLKLAKSGCVVFLGCFPGIEDKYPVIAWGSFFCFVLHGFAHPVEWVPRVRLRRWSKRL